MTEEESNMAQENSVEKTGKAWAPRVAGTKKSAPSISRYTAPGLRALIAATDLERAKADPLVARGLAYVTALAEFLESPVFAKRSEEQRARADLSRQRRGVGKYANTDRKD